MFYFVPRITHVHIPGKDRSLPNSNLRCHFEQQISVTNSFRAMWPSQQPLSINLKAKYKLDKLTLSTENKDISIPKTPIQGGGTGRQEH